MHHARESQVIEDLRQDRRHAETPPPENGRPRVEVLCDRSTGLFQAVREWPRAPAAAIPVRSTRRRRCSRARCNGLAQGFQRGRLPGGHLLENLGGKKQVARCVAGLSPTAGQLCPQRGAQGRRGDERQVQQVRFAGIIIFAGGVQEVVGCLKSCSGFVVIAAASRHRRGQQLALEGRLIETVHVADAHGDRLDHIVGSIPRRGNRPPGRHRPSAAGSRASPGPRRSSPAGGSVRG